MSGRSQADRLALLQARLSERDHAVLSDIARFRFLTSGQIGRLHFAAIPVAVTRSRRVQHQLGRLVQLGLVSRLERRQGGVRAGSSGYTYTTTAEGHRLAAIIDGRAVPAARRISEPGSTFVAHTLACSDVYVSLPEAQRDGRLEVLAYQQEPDCWRDFHRLAGRITLKPDAFASLGVGAFEHRSFIEVDRGTEGSGALRRKLGVYVDYWRSGAEQTAHGVFPRVVWIMDRPARVVLLKRLVAEVPAEQQRLFVVCLPSEATVALTGGAS